MRIIRYYGELIQIPTFEGRFEYLKLSGIVGESTFGWERYLNQIFYTSKKWRTTRNAVIIRDNGLDMAMPGYEIVDKLIVHHINPITEEDIHSEDYALFDLNNLVCVSYCTHNAIHYGDKSLLTSIPKRRYSGDTSPWKGGCN